MRNRFAGWPVCRFAGLPFGLVKSRRGGIEPVQKGSNLILYNNKLKGLSGFDGLNEPNEPNELNELNEPNELNELNKSNRLTGKRANRLTD